MNKPPLFSALLGVVPLLALACCKTAEEKVTEVKGGSGDGKSQIIDSPAVGEGLMK